MKTGFINLRNIKEISAVANMAYHIVPYHDAEQVPIAKDPLDGFIKSFSLVRLFFVYFNAT